MKGSKILFMTHSTGIIKGVKIREACYFNVIIECALLFLIWKNDIVDIVFKEQVNEWKALRIQYYPIIIVNKNFQYYQH